MLDEFRFIGKSDYVFVDHPVLDFGFTLTFCLTVCRPRCIVAFLEHDHKVGNHVRVEMAPNFEVVGICKATHPANSVLI